MRHPVPTWLSSAILYQIYPQSFLDTNGDGIGDLEGIIRKLDYIADLGCTAIWLNPVFDSPFEDAGYDVRDFYKIAPRYGNNTTFVRLCREAHKRGLRVLLDLVAGHTSWEHPWFRESCRAEKNDFSGRYIWIDNVWKPSPAGVNTVQGISERDGRYVTNFFVCQPALNYGFYKTDEPWQIPMNHPDALATR